MLIVFILILLFIFKGWFFSSGSLSSGDWPFLFLENIQEYSYIPIEHPPWLAPYHQILTKILVENLSVPFFIIERVFWFGMYIVLSSFSSWYLYKKIRVSTKYTLVASIIYLLNTYVLMIVDGGQMGVVLAYSIAPFVLARFVDQINHILLLKENLKFKIKNVKPIFFNGLVLSLQIMFDPRIALLTLGIIGLYGIFNILFTPKKNRIRDLLFVLLFIFIALFIAIVSHSYWIIPQITGERNVLEGLGENYSSVEVVKFFSFASFSQSFSLLHPNWPENIFGKVYFMRAEFLVLPIIAYASLLFINLISRKKAELRRLAEAEQRRNILFFAFIGLLGAFLGKGTQEPFGWFYIWLYDTIPGMVSFRDPTKFYLLTALSYSVLIPFTLEKFTEDVNLKFKSQNAKMQLKIQKYLELIIFILFTIYWMFLIRAALFGELDGTFKARTIPNEYVRLKNLIISDQAESNTLWIPKRQRFGFASMNHEAIDGDSHYTATDSARILDKLRFGGNKKLTEHHVKYIIVPFDTHGELFIHDRKYDPHQYEMSIRELEKIPWLSRVEGYGKIAVFELKQSEN